jgi:hypothetical protein
MLDMGKPNLYPINEVGGGFWINGRELKVGDLLFVEYGGGKIASGTFQYIDNNIPAVVETKIYQGVGDFKEFGGITELDSTGRKIDVVTEVHPPPSTIWLVPGRKACFVD